MCSLYILCLLSLVGTLHGVKNGLYGFDVKMLSDPKAPRMLLVNSEGSIYNDVLSSQEMTWCVYAYFAEKQRKSYHTMVCYSTKEPKSLNEVLLEANVDANNTVLYLRGKDKTVSGAPARNKWTLVCLSWSGITGEAHYYLDGVESAKITDLAKGETLGKNGVLVLGKDQDDFDSGYSPKDGVYGRMTQFNAWDKVLKPEELKLVMDGKKYGNLVDWRESEWALADNAIIVPSNAPNVASQKLPCKEGKVTEGTDLTISLRFRGELSSQEAFTLFYYMNDYGAQELSLIVNERRSVAVVVGDEKREVPHLLVSEGIQNWGFTWSKGTLSVYIDGGFYGKLTDFMEGTKMSTNGNLYVFEANSRRRIPAKTINYRVWERALSAEEVAYEYYKQEPAKFYRNIPAGYISAGNIPAGYFSAGNIPAGYTPAGNIPYGYIPAGYTPAGKSPAGKSPAGSSPPGKNPAGDMEVDETVQYVRVFGQPPYPMRGFGGF